jgi:hypothetical protein
MTPQYYQLLNDTTPKTWDEELARAKKYKEATQKRRAEKLVRKELDKLKKTLQVGRLKIEP